MGVPRRVVVKGMQGIEVTVVVTVVQGTVWLSISPPFTWEAIMEPGKVDEVMHVLELARDEATKAAAASNGSTRRAGNVVRAITKNTTNPHLLGEINR
jgi:Na+/proline symporter